MSAAEVLEWAKENKEEIDAMYMKWIDKNYPTHEAALGQCAKATQEMQKVFPWLIRTRGIVHTMHGEFPHWWLECHLISRVVDPTSRQFVGIFHWEELPDDDPRCKYQRQKCMNCGTEFYSEKFACTDKCEKELTEWLG